MKTFRNVVITLIVIALIGALYVTKPEGCSGTEVEMRCVD